MDRWNHLIFLLYCFVNAEFYWFCEKILCRIAKLHRKWVSVKARSNYLPNDCQFICYIIFCFKKLKFTWNCLPLFSLFKVWSKWSVSKLDTKNILHQYRIFMSIRCHIWHLKYYYIVGQEIRLSAASFYLKYITIYPIKSCGGFSVESWPLSSTGSYSCSTYWCVFGLISMLICF